MEVVRKTATITPTGSETDFPGTFEVILSAPTKDRDGDTLLPEEWKQPLPEHITFDIDHGMSVATTVGSGTPSIDAKTGNLVVRGTYSSLDRAQEVRTLVNEGHIRTTSVAFMNEPATVKNGKKVNQRELLNGAFVAVPSNREAVITNSKGIDLKYSPDQPRDENGRFGFGDEGSTVANFGSSRTGLQHIESLQTNAQDMAQLADDSGLRSTHAAFGAIHSAMNSAAAAKTDYHLHKDWERAASGADYAATSLARAAELISAAVPGAATDAERIASEARASSIAFNSRKSFFRAELKYSPDQERDDNGRSASGGAYGDGTKSLYDYSTKSSSDSTNIDSDVSEEAKSAEEVLKAAAKIAAAIEADSAEDADSVSLKAQAMNIIVEALASEN